MATAVYDEVDVVLQDNEEVVLKPLPIAQLRRFMKAWKEMANLPGETDEEKEEASFTVFVNCAGIALENHFKSQDKFTETKGKLKDPLSKEYREYLENVLDMDTIYKIMEVCGGLKLNDPNLLAALEQANLANQD
jgi:hypothetical protein